MSFIYYLRTTPTTANIFIIKHNYFAYARLNHFSKIKPETVAGDIKGNLYDATKNLEESCEKVYCSVVHKGT